MESTFEDVQGEGRLHVHPECRPVLRMSIDTAFRARLRVILRISLIVITDFAPW